MALGIYEAGAHVTANGPTVAFRFARLTPERGLWIFVASIAAAGIWDGAKIHFEFKLAGEWHRTLVTLSAAQHFWKIQEAAAIIGTAYRFVLEDAGAGTDLSIEVASPRELVIDGTA